MAKKKRSLLTKVIDMVTPAPAPTPSTRDKHGMLIERGTMLEMDKWKAEKRARRGPLPPSSRRNVVTKAMKDRAKKKKDALARKAKAERDRYAKLTDAEKAEEYEKRWGTAGAFEARMKAAGERIDKEKIWALKNPKAAAKKAAKRRELEAWRRARFAADLVKSRMGRDPVKSEKAQLAKWKAEIREDAKKKTALTEKKKKKTLLTK